MDIGHKETIAIFHGPSAPQIDHGAAVGMASPRQIRAIVAAVGIVSQIVSMIGDGVNIGKGIGVKMGPCLPKVAPAGNDVKGVGDDASLDKGLAIIVEIKAPRVAGALANDFEDVFCRMIAPDPGV